MLSVFLIYVSYMVDILLLCGYYVVVLWFPYGCFAVALWPAAPRLFGLCFGLALDVASGCLYKIPWGTINLLLREYIKYSWETPQGLHSLCYLLAFPTDCPSHDLSHTQCVCARCPGMSPYIKQSIYQAVHISSSPAIEQSIYK